MLLIVKIIMPLVKNGYNKAQLENAIKKSLDSSPINPTKAQKTKQKKGKSLEELSDIYDNMHSRKNR